MGGASAARQFLDAGLVDAMRIHLAPVLLGAGTRLFDNIRQNAGQTGEDLPTRIPVRYTSELSCPPLTPYRERALGSDAIFARLTNPLSRF